MSITGTTAPSLISPKADAGIVIAMCALAGAAAGMATDIHMLAIPLTILMLAGGFICSILFGFPGLLSLTPVLLAFLLLNRFDELFVIPLDMYVALKPTFYLTALCLVLLGVYVMISPNEALLKKPAQRRFLLRMQWTLFAFIAAGLLSIGLNRLFDDYLIHRDATGELLALASVVMPVGFLLLLPRRNMNRERTLRCIRFMIAMGGLAGFIMAAFGILPGRVLDLIGWTRAMGGTVDLVRGRLPLGHPNSVAAVILLLMPPAMVFALACDKGFWRLFHLACAGLMFLGVLFALSRSALLCLMLVLAPTMLYLIWRSRGRRRFVLVSLSGGFCVALTVMALYLFSQYDFSRFWSRAYHEDASVERRADSMYTALAIWRDYPVLGISPDAFYTRFETRRDWSHVSQDEISGMLFYKGRISAESPHNVFLMAFSEFGAVGGSLFLMLLYALMRMLWRARKYPGISEYDQFALAGLFFGFCGFLLMQLFGVELLAGQRATTVFWVMAAFAAHYAGLAESECADIAALSASEPPHPSEPINTP